MGLAVRKPTYCIFKQLRHRSCCECIFFGTCIVWTLGVLYAEIHASERQASVTDEAWFVLPGRTPWIFFFFFFFFFFFLFFTRLIWKKALKWCINACSKLEFDASRDLLVLLWNISIPCATSYSRLLLSFIHVRNNWAIMWHNKQRGLCAQQRLRSVWAST